MTTERSNTGHGEVFNKALLPASFDPLASLSRDVGGGMHWPIAPTSLLLLYLGSPEHARCIHLIAEGAFGGGLVDGKGEIIPGLEDLFDGGSTTTFVDLGVDLGTYGNAYLQRVFNRATGRIVLMRRLPAITMRKYGTAGFVQTTRDQYGMETRTFFAPDEIVHLKPPCPMGHFYALPDWISASGMIELANAATEWNATFFKNGAMPEYAMIVKGSTLTDPQKQAAREFFRREFRGLDNAHKTLFLSFDNKETEVDFERITAEMKDGDFLKMLDAARDRIHMAHGVPPRLLGIMHAGGLGGGGEITGQLKIFEDLRLSAIRRRTRDQMAPTYRALGLNPADIRHRPLDLTPPDTDREKVKDWLDANIIDRDEARSLAGIDGETALAKSRAGRLAVLTKMLAES
ncbi:MAG: phage portal protein [Rhodospirillaceae bacterium]|nr:phage portal protein [Rhodospirillales bacterium]